MEDNFCMKCKHYKRKDWWQKIDRWHWVKQYYGICTKQREKCRKISKCWFFEIKEGWEK